MAVLRLLSTVALILLGTPALAWVPEILPRYDVANNPDAIDFRRAGFVETERAWNQWNREVVELTPPSGDATTMVQAAVDQVGAAGGGTVRLTQGTWTFSTNGVRLRHPGVRVEGDTSGTTTISIPTLMTRGTYVFMGGRSPYNTYIGSQSYLNTWVRQGVAPNTEFLAEDAAANSNTVRVDAPLRAVGDSLILCGTPTDAFIAEHGMTGVWTTAMDYPAYLRTIVEVLPDGYRLDMPVRYPLKVRDQARCFIPTQIVRDLSVARLRIEFARHPATNYDIASPGDSDTSWQTAIQFINVDGGLIEDIEIPLLPSRGVELAYSRHVTVRRCKILESQNRNSTSNGYHFFVSGCDNLLRDNYSANGRRAFTFLLAVSSGNVLYNNTSVSPDLPSDYHMHLSHENLVDSHHGINDHWESIFRPSGGPIPHGISGTQNTFWNIDSDHAISVRSAQHGLGYVVGTSGAVSLDPANGFAALPLDHAEGAGERSTMEPPSIYLYQLGEGAH